MTFSVEEAREKLEMLTAMAFNGQLVLIKKGDDLVRMEPIQKRLTPNQVWTAEDFYE